MFAKIARLIVQNIGIAKPLSLNRGGAFTVFRTRLRLPAVFALFIIIIFYSSVRTDERHNNCRRRKKTNVCSARYLIATGSSGRNRNEGFPLLRQSKKRKTDIRHLHGCRVVFLCNRFARFAEHNVFVGDNASPQLQNWFLRKRAISHSCLRTR